MSRRSRQLAAEGGRKERRIGYQVGARGAHGHTQPKQGKEGMLLLLKQRQDRGADRRGRQSQFSAHSFWGVAAFNMQAAKWLVV